MGGPRREKREGRGLPPLWSPRTAPPAGGARPGRRPSGGAGRRRPPEEEGGGGCPLNRITGGGCCPLQQKERERGLAPLSNQAQGPRWAPGCPRPPATAGGAQDQGWLRPPQKRKGGKWESWFWVFVVVMDLVNLWLIGGVVEELEVMGGRRGVG